MCIMRENNHFYSFDYSVILNLHKSGGVSGFLTILPDYYSTIKYPLQGCYINQNDLVKFAFSVDWSFPDEKNWGFTCFSGQFVNHRILILDWMLVENKSSDNFGITGSDYLCSSSLYLNER